MTENNGWACCGIPAPEEDGFDWRKKAAEEESEKENTGEKAEEAQE